jgi:tRNA threonylcarbamoyladenosine biosynthesis protein TsaE
MQILSRSVQDTLKLGRKISRHLKRGDIICLFGELGSGKTVLTKGIVEGLGGERNKVISPSFVLIRRYVNKKLPLYHFDLYRLNSEKDIIGLGYEEYFYDEAVSVIEWADRLRHLLPKEYLKIKLRVLKGGKRGINVTHLGKRYEKIIKLLYADIRH